MLFSIILPTYNHADTLGRAIASILKQQTGQLEIIVVDDGSTDHTCEVASKWMTQNVQYYYQVNQGVSAARNFGAAKASGLFLVFLDADDWLSDNFFSIAASVIEERKCKLLLGYIAFQNSVKEETSRTNAWKKPGAFAHSLPGAFVIDKELFHSIGAYD